jgi:hypothetical protein
LEKTFERKLEHQALAFPVLIKEMSTELKSCNGTIRIIDYKTGKVDKASVSLKLGG